MAKVKNPATFSGYFGVDPYTLKKLGVLDPTLAIEKKKKGTLVLKQLNKSFDYL